MRNEDLLKELVQCVDQIIKHKLQEHTKREIKVSRGGTQYVEFKLDVTAEEIKEIMKQTVEDLYRQIAVPSHMLMLNSENKDENA